ncbi:MAG: hypothetical protein SFU85_11900 [Candidatus Methylacidiphilales bacterium]|nr:hypothetical protein [Candidatus Methylacidiphilales bacterium]
MKAFQLFALTALLASPALTLSAQSGGDFSAPATGRDVRELRPGKPEELRGAKGSGVVVMMSQRGLEVISPFAPRSAGLGQKTLTPNIARDGRIGDEAHDRKPFGGIALVGFEF